MQNTQTAIDYSALEAGRELDALIAEKIFSYKLDYEFADEMGAPCVPEMRDKYDEWGLLPNYSTDIADAFQIVNKFTDRKTPFSMKYDVNYGYDKQTGWGIAIDGVSVVAFCDSLPLAICRAALDTLTWHFPPLAAAK